MSDFTKRVEGFIESLNLSPDERRFALEESVRINAECLERYQEKYRQNPEFRPVALAAAFGISLMNAEEMVEDWPK